MKQKHVVIELQMIRELVCGALVDAAGHLIARIHEAGEEVCATAEIKDGMTPMLWPGLTSEEVSATAKAVHLNNRMYCERIGDGMTPPPWPDVDHTGLCAAVQCLAEHPWLTEEDLHSRWKEQRLKEGWCWGFRKDPIRKLHPNMCPYKELPASQARKDFLFRELVCGVMVEKFRRMAGIVVRDVEDSGWIESVGREVYIRCVEGGPVGG